jgi:putative aldouronate transport system substrate-binding protein
MEFDDPVAKKITEATGVTLKVDHPVGGDLTAIPLMIASGEFPDMIFAKGNLNILIEADAVLRLDDLIAKRGKNMRDLYGDQLGRLKASLDDPYIYHVGTFGVKQAVWNTEGNMQIQHAVLKDQGYPKMQTLDDYEKAIKAYMAKYPTINGLRTIGLSLLSDTWQWYIDVSNPSGMLIGYPDDGQWIVDQNTLQAQYKFLHPDAKLWYKWLNRMNAEGVLDPESFTQKEDQWQAKIASGRVLGLSYPLWGWGNARTSLINEGRPERTMAYLPIQADERFKSPMLKDYGFGGGWGIAITKACKDPERLFEFLDWWCTEEAQVLVNWGIQGTNYEVRNGKRIFLDQEKIMVNPNYSQQTGVGRWIHPFPQRGTGYIDSTGNWITRDSPETIKENYLPIEKETLAAYGVEMWMDLFPTTASLGVSKHGQAWQYTLTPELNAITSEADNYIKTALANIVLGRPENFEATWTRILQDLRAMGIDDANKALTQMIQDKMKLWGTK